MPFSFVPWKTMAAGLAIALVAALWWRGDYHARRAATNELLLAAARSANEQYIRLAEEQAEIHARTGARLSANVSRKAKARADTEQERKAITDAPTEDDAPLAAVLRRELDRLPDAAGPAGYASATGNSRLSSGAQPGTL